jgi:hypothetical protein
MGEAVVPNGQFAVEVFERITSDRLSLRVVVYKETLADAVAYFVQGSQMVKMTVGMRLNRWVVARIWQPSVAKCIIAKRRLISGRWFHHRRIAHGKSSGRRRDKSGPTCVSQMPLSTRDSFLSMSCLRLLSPTRLVQLLELMYHFQHNGDGESVDTTVLQAASQ